MGGPNYLQIGTLMIRAKYWLLTSHMFGPVFFFGAKCELMNPTKA